MAAPAIDSSELGYFVMIGAGVGAMIGGWPASAALSKGRTGMAIVSVLLCSGAGALGGCLFALPLAWILTLFIKGMGSAGDWEARPRLGPEEFPRERQRRPGSRQRGAVEPNPRIADQPYTAIGHVLVCNGCRQSTSKGPGGSIPPECPTCGLRFGAKKSDSSDRRPAPRMARMAQDDVVELRPADERVRR